MRIVQSVCGVFHHFDIANELERRGLLEQIYSSYPWRRLQREGLPRNKVTIARAAETVALLDIALRRTRAPLGSRVYRSLSDATGALFEGEVARHASPVDLFFALSGCALKSGRAFQKRGAAFIVDRGSTHIAFHRKILMDEFARWGQTGEWPTLAMVQHDEEEYAVADAISVPSSFAVRTFVEQGVPREKVLLLPYGVRLDRFYPDGQPDAKSFDVLFVGRVGLRKGVPYLLEAFQRFQHPRKRLRIAGTIAPEITGILQRYNLSHVEFLGPVAQPEVRRLMSTSRCLVLPSLEEGLALVQGQALACGCPVIATTNTGGEDLFTDGVEGFIVPVRNPQGIAGKLEALAENPDLEQRMRAAALERVKFLGGWSTYVDRFLMEAEKLVARKRAG